MRKILFFTVLVSLTILSSCAKDESGDAGQKPAIILDIEVQGFWNATKSVKTGWVSGDKLNVWIDGNCAAEPDIIFTHDGSKWVCSTLREEASLKSSGTMSVLYEGFNDLTSSSYEAFVNDGVIAKFLPLTSMQIDSNWAFQVPLWVSAEAVAYTYDTGTNILRCSVADWTFNNNVQITVTGLSGTLWALKSDGLMSKAGIGVSTSGAIDSYDISYSEYTLGVPYDTGEVTFYGNGRTRDTYNFMLMNSNGDRFFYSVSGKTLNTDSKTLGAVVIPFSKFSDDSIPELSLSRNSVVLGVRDTLSIAPYLSYENIDSKDLTISSTNSEVVGLCWNQDTKLWNIYTRGVVGESMVIVRGKTCRALMEVTAEDDFLMYASDVVSVSGKGTAATGTALSGTVNKGDSINIFTPSDATADHHTEVTYIEQSRKELQSYSYGSGAAGIYFADVAKADLPKGSLLMTPGSKRPVIATRLTLSVNLSGRTSPVMKNYQPSLTIGGVNYTVTFSDLGAQELLNPSTEYHNITADVASGKVAVFIGQRVPVMEGNNTVGTAVITDATPIEVTYTDPS